MSEATPLRPGRVTISGDAPRRVGTQRSAEVYKIDGKEVVLMGGNYVVKASKMQYFIACQYVFI